MRVLVVGDAMLDVVVRPLGPLAPTSDTPARVRLGRGGAAANLAVALAAADASVQVEYAAAVGDDAAGELFRRELEKLDDRTVFYLDECGVDHRLYREFGRAPRGDRIYEAVAGKRRERTSIIAAAQHDADGAQIKACLARFQPVTFKTMGRQDR